MCYHNGAGVGWDAAEAVRWFRKAAGQGLAEAQHNLGVCYHNGVGVGRDTAEAVRWLRKAAAQGDADAQKGIKENNEVTFRAADMPRDLRPAFHYSLLSILCPAFH